MIVSNPLFPSFIPFRTVRHLTSQTPVQEVVQWEQEEQEYCLLSLRTTHHGQGTIRFKMWLFTYSGEGLFPLHCSLKVWVLFFSLLFRLHFWIVAYCFLIRAHRSFVYVSASLKQHVLFMKQITNKCFSWSIQTKVLKLFFKTSNINYDHSIKPKQTAWVTRINKESHPPAIPNDGRPIS